jgi:hypothetical protein
MGFSADIVYSLGKQTCADISLDSEDSTIEQMFVYAFRLNYLSWKADLQKSGAAF